MKKVYNLILNEETIATITLHRDEKIIAWGSEELYLGNYLINTILDNAQDDMVDLSYVAFEVE